MLSLARLLLLLLFFLHLGVLCKVTPDHERMLSLLLVLLLVSMLLVLVLLLLYAVAVVVACAGSIRVHFLRHAEVLVVVRLFRAALAGRVNPLRPRGCRHHRRRSVNAQTVRMLCHCRACTGLALVVCVVQGNGWHGILAVVMVVVAARDIGVRLRMVELVQPP